MAVHPARQRQERSPGLLLDFLAAAGWSVTISDGNRVEALATRTDRHGSLSARASGESVAEVSLELLRGTYAAQRARNGASQRSLSVPAIVGGTSHGS